MDPSDGKYRAIDARFERRNCKIQMGASDLQAFAAVAPVAYREGRAEALLIVAHARIQRLRGRIVLVRAR